MIKFILDKIRKYVEEKKLEEKNMMLFSNCIKAKKDFRK